MIKSVNKLTNDSNSRFSGNVTIDVHRLADILPSISKSDVRDHHLVAALVGASADDRDPVCPRGADDLFVISVAEVRDFYS